MLGEEGSNVTVGKLAQQSNKDDRGTLRQASQTHCSRQETPPTINVGFWRRTGRKMIGVDDSDDYLK